MRFLFGESECQQNAFHKHARRCHLPLSGNVCYSECVRSGEQHAYVHVC